MQVKTPLTRRQALLGALAAGAALALPALADPLSLPARQAARASGALLLALAKAGQRLVAAGERGLIIFSDDGGRQWQQATVPVSITFTALCFADQRNGWAVGHDGAVLATRDAGATWRKQLDGLAINALALAAAQDAQTRARAALDAAPGNAAARKALEAAERAHGDLAAGAKFGPSKPLLGVWFRDGATGYAVGAFGQVLRTDNGGQRWQDLTLSLDNPDGLHLNAVTGDAAGNVMIAAEGGKVFHSADGGARWRTLDTGYNGHLYGIVTAAPATATAGAPVAASVAPQGKARGDSRALLAFGFGGTLLRSEDGGATWRPLPHLTRQNLVAAVRTADGALLLVARNGAQLRSTDQGRSFTLTGPGGGVELASAVAAGNVVLGAGARGIHLLRKPGTPA